VEFIFIKPRVKAEMSFQVNLSFKINIKYMKKIVLAALVSISNLILAQQSINKEFQISFGSQSLIPFNSQSTIPKLLTIKNNSYLLHGGNKIVQLDSIFNIIWSKSVEQNVQSNSILGAGKLYQMPDSNYMFWSTKKFTQPLSPPDTLLYAVISNAGNISSQKRFDQGPFFYFAFVLDVQPTNDSGFIVLFKYRTASFNLDTKYSLVRYNKFGTKVWSNHYNPGQSYDPLLTIADNQSIYLMGSYINNLNVALYTMKFDLNGNLIWKKEINTLRNYFQSVSSMKNGLVFSYFRIQNNSTIYGLVNLDTNGNVIRQKQLNRSFKVLKSLPNGGLIGASTNNSIVKFDSALNIDWVTKPSLNISDIVVRAPYPYLVLGSSSSATSIISLDANGNTLSCIGLDTVTIFNDSIQFSNSNISVAYNTSFTSDFLNNSITSNNISIPSNTGCIASSINTLVNKRQSSIICYPNPSNGLIEISNNEGVGFSIEIFDVLGHQVYFKENNLPYGQLDLLALSKGLYFYSIKTKTEGLYTNKLVIK
jgi:Secretion system C-terminal sorting domain